MKNVATVNLHSQFVFLCRTSLLETDIIGGGRKGCKGEKERSDKRLLELWT